MHITMTMLALLLVSRLNELYWDSRELGELLGGRAAEAEEAKESEEATHEEADAKKEEEGDEHADTEESEEDVAKEDEEGHDEAAKEEGEHKEEAAKEDEGEEEHADAEEEEGGHGEAKEEKKEPTTQGEGKLTLKQIEELKAKEAAAPYSQTELDLLQNLTKRRQELDDREAELEIKSKVLGATEKRINDKLGEMKTLQTDLSKVVAEYNNQQDAEVKSLVKIYESMKPAQAAAIFNELDMPILLSVIDKMSERKVAPVLAGMDPKRARDVTQELAELRRKSAAMKNAANTAAAR